eukprot:3087277-Pyramimonas_sp.AAC.1
MTTTMMETNIPQVGWRQIYRRTDGDRMAAKGTNIPQVGWRQIYHRSAGDKYTAGRIVIGWPLGRR